MSGIDGGDSTPIAAPVASAIGAEIRVLTNFGKGEEHKKREIQIEKSATTRAHLARSFGPLAN